MLSIYITFPIDSPIFVPISLLHSIIGIPVTLTHASLSNLIGSPFHSTTSKNNSSQYSLNPILKSSASISEPKVISILTPPKYRTSIVFGNVPCNVSPKDFNFFISLTTATTDLFFNVLLNSVSSSDNRILFPTPTSLLFPVKISLYDVCSLFHMVCPPLLYCFMQLLLPGLFPVSFSEL
ncbi:hypothetical protein HanIR_Chr08g0343501 [Helianthus annuus]|nr:hypothetical protein HanIR_Chr08g0343501 [Helianthus annuus]